MPTLQIHVPPTQTVRTPENEPIGSVLSDNQSRLYLRVHGGTMQLDNFEHFVPESITLRDRGPYLNLGLLKVERL